MLKMEMFVFRIGDELFYDRRLCKITAITPNGVYVKDNRVHRFISCEELKKRNFEYEITFSKNGVKGASHATNYDSACEEKNLLESIGWEIDMHLREVAQ